MPASAIKPAAAIKPASAIKKVAVIGAGTMGAGIAAQIANGGVEVVLFDIVPKGANDRSALARSAVAKLLKAEPAAFMDGRNARRITPANLEDDLDKLGDVDWIVEAVAENLEIKVSVYKKLEAARRKGSVVSSNTSTIPLADLCAELPARFAGDFLITHFFNPPRYMRLLELVSGPKTRPEATAAVQDFADRVMGKSVVHCNDTPGFIANRVGVRWLMTGVISAIEGGLTAEEADAVGGRPMGIPPTGIFGLLDLVGLDVMPQVLGSLERTLGADDAIRAMPSQLGLIDKMVAAGHIGRKSGAGFYRRRRDANGKSVKETIDLTSAEYRPFVAARLDSVRAAKGGLRALVEHGDKGGVYAWRVLKATLSYAAALVPEIADDIAAVDEAMRLGYNWKYGPFELIDQLGAGWFADRLAAEGADVPPLLEAARATGFYRVEGGRRQYLGVDGAYHDMAAAVGVVRLADVKLGTKPLAKNAGASLWDVGDGVTCLEFHTKMNALDPDILEMIGKSLAITGRGHKGMVIYNEAENFSVGANIGLILGAANIAAWSEVEKMIEAGQKTFKAIKYAPFPVVAAPAGMALGGGCEVVLHCAAVQAHAETYMGLVEVGVGLIPGWGGTGELLARCMANPKRPGGPMPPLAQAFEAISLAQVSKSAALARSLMFLRPDDGITMNRDRLLADAKARVLALAEGYRAPEPPSFALPGPTAAAALGLAVSDVVLVGKASAHDAVVAGALAEVLSGGATDITDLRSEAEMMALERAAFMRLLRLPATLARIEHMLLTGRPLRN